MMKATGVLFLTSRPYLVRVNSPVDGPTHDWAFPLVDRGERGTQSLVAFWRGAAAAAFVEAHAAVLKGGAALHLELDRLAPYTINTLRARVQACSLAPERWPGKPKSANPPIPTHPTPIPQVGMA